MKKLFQVILVIFCLSLWGCREDSPSGQSGLLGNPPDNKVSVPEPSILILLGAGISILIYKTKRRNKGENRSLANMLD